MTFEDLLDQAIELRRRRQRLSYRMLKRQFDLDDDVLDDLKVELIKSQRLAVDEDGEVLVWTGEAPVPASQTPPPAAPVAPSLSPPTRTTAFDDKLDQLQRYLPSYLSDKILGSRGRLEGERKVVTVLFVDLADYTAISEQLGEEVMFGVMDALYELLIHEVHRYEGTVNELTGDGIVAFFGAPLAVEKPRNGPSERPWLCSMPWGDLARHSSVNTGTACRYGSASIPDR